MTEAAAVEIERLLQGNERFRQGLSAGYRYAPEHISELSNSQRPTACIIACSDSRVTPEIIFDQPLGSLFVYRVPGNVYSEGAKWVVELAVNEFQVPLVLVLGHTGCLAVTAVYEGHVSMQGSLQFSILPAVLRARSLGEHDTLRASIRENAKQTMENLLQEIDALRHKVDSGNVTCASAVYDMATGFVELIRGQEA